MKAFGLIIVDKPVGPTSHRIVNLVRRSTGVRKVGHAGTLDPRASGVLILCLGPATRLSEYLSTSSKRYEALVRFGSSTQTYDAEGEILSETGSSPDHDTILEVLPEFRGEIEQVPPPYSAIKVRGKKAYDLARSGEEVQLEARKVTIQRLDVLSYHPPDLSLDVECTAGTYIRSLAHDLGERLATGAHLANLRRSQAGPFTLDDAVSLAELEMSFTSGDWEQYVLPAADALPDLPLVEVDGDDLDHLRNGRRIRAVLGAGGKARAIGPDGDLVAILESVEDGKAWHPRKVFQS